MPIFRRAILTHGGAGSDIQDSDGPQATAKVGLDLMRNSKPALDAVVQAVRYLEDDPRFNSGLGSQLRINGCTIQIDASCMTSSGEFGAVAFLEDIKNPIDLPVTVCHGHILRRVNNNDNKFIIPGSPGCNWR